jgi:hypothetical protein
LASLVLLAALPAHAQHGYKWESFDDRVDAAHARSLAIDDTAFGEIHRPADRSPEASR